MKLRLLVILFAAWTAHAAASWKVTLPSDLMAGGTALKKGVYTVYVQDRKAVFKQGKQGIAIPVDVEKNPDKFRATLLNLSGNKLLSIDLGGTDTMLVFPDPR